MEDIKESDTLYNQLEGLFAEYIQPLFNTVSMHVPNFIIDDIMLQKSKVFELVAIGNSNIGKSTFLNDLINLEVELEQQDLFTAGEGRVTQSITRVKVDSEIYKNSYCIEQIFHEYENTYTEKENYETAQQLLEALQLAQQQAADIDDLELKEIEVSFSQNSRESILQENMMITDIPGITDGMKGDLSINYLEKHRDRIFIVLIIKLTQGTINLSQFQNMPSWFQDCKVMVPIIFTCFNNMLNDVEMELRKMKITQQTQPQDFNRLRMEGAQKVINSLISGIKDKIKGPCKFYIYNPRSTLYDYKHDERGYIKLIPRSARKDEETFQIQSIEQIRQNLEFYCSLDLPNDFFKQKCSQIFRDCRNEFHNFVTNNLQDERLDAIQLHMFNGIDKYRHHTIQKCKDLIDEQVLKEIEPMIKQYIKEFTDKIHKKDVVFSDAFKNKLNLEVYEQMKIHIKKLEMELEEKILMPEQNYLLDIFIKNLEDNTFEERKEVDRSMQGVFIMNPLISTFKNYGIFKPWWHLNKYLWRKKKQSKSYKKDISKLIKAEKLQQALNDELEKYVNQVADEYRHRVHITISELKICKNPNEEELKTIDVLQKTKFTQAFALLKTFESQLKAQDILVD